MKNLREKQNIKESSKTIGINDVKIFLKYLIDLKGKDNSEENVIKKNASIINWVHCYKDKITTILQMFTSLSSVVDNLTDKIKKIREEEPTKSDEEESVSSIVNSALFSVMESILKVVTSNADIYLTYIKNSDEFYELMNINKEILQNALKLEANLHLSTKEAFSLQEIVEIFDSLSKIEKDNKDKKLTDENIKKIINYFSEESSLLKKDEIDVEEIFNHFENFYQFLAKLFEQNEMFPKLMSIIFQNEYRKISIKEFRIKLFELVISKNEFIYNCYPLLKLMLKKINISTQPKNIKNNLEDLKNNNDPLMVALNSQNSEFLDQAILQIFEHSILEYFGNIEKMDKKIDKEDKACLAMYIEKKEKGAKDYKKYIIFDKSMELFEDCIQNLIDMNKGNLNSNSSSETKEISNLSKLYSIAFIKIYLTKFVEFIDNYDNQDLEKVFCCISRHIRKNDNLIKVIKIYILKNVYNLKNRNWARISEYDFTRKNEFNDIQINSQSFLINYFLPLDDSDEKEFNKVKEIFKSIINIHQSSENQENKGEESKTSKGEESKGEESKGESSEESKENKENKIDLFLSFSINKIISNLLLDEYLTTGGEGEENYKKLCKYFKENVKCSNSNLEKLLNLFFDKEQFNKLKNKFDEQCKDKQFINEPYESLLYGLKFCVQSLLAETLNSYNSQKLFYSSILSEESLETINKSYIPGNNAKKNKKLETLKMLKYLLYNSNADTGYYVCSCGYLYSIGPCGFPTKEYSSKCPICGLQIGYGEKVVEKGARNHGMAIRDGHYRIFKNEKQKEEQMSRFGDVDENIPNRTLEQYENIVMNSLLSSSQKGILQETKEDFLDKNKSIRKMSKISYRLLNFILFNHLFFANCLGYISDEQLKEGLLIQGMNCLEIIQSNWNLLEEALKENNISSIQIFLQAFMNIIFKESPNLLSNCTILENEEELINFEEEIEKRVQTTIKKYPEYYERYQKMIKQNNLNNEKDIKILVNETFPPSEDIYPESEFPLLKYFMYTEYKINFKNSLEQEEDYLAKYPLLNGYLNNPEYERLIKYLPEFNEFTNSMVETYSYHITREEAKRDKLKNREEYDNTKFEAFDKVWKKIYKYATKYKCRDDMKPKELKNSDCLIYFLNDANELGNGMYLAAACQNFISWQNGFLQSIIDAEKFNGNLHYYIENMKKKVPLQEANRNQIVSLDDCFKDSEYKDFDDLVYTYTKRDIYFKETINYQRYNKFIIDFETIEEELGKLILPEKCLFENEDHLNFMIFWGEGFRGGQSSTIVKLYEKYPQVDLNEEERKKIYKDIQKLYEDNNFNSMSFFGSMQLLLFHLGNNNFPSNKDLNSILNERPDYLKLDDNCIKFFSNNNFKINQIMNIFFYSEHLSFKELKNMLQPEYKKPIDEKIIKEIIKQFEQKEENKIISWKVLAAAVRRFISRYLVGNRQDTEVNENMELAIQLSRIDLWEEKIGKLGNLEELIAEKISKFKIKVGEALSFYNIIGKEDENSINIEQMKPKEENIPGGDQEDEDEQNDNNNEGGDDNLNDDLNDNNDNDDNGDNGYGFGKDAVELE